MQPKRRVILLVESTSMYGRGCLRGIARYARTQGGWAFFHNPRMLSEPPTMGELRRWKADGIIARIESHRIGSMVRALKVPAVDIRGPHAVKDVPGIFSDDRVIIQLAVDHLLANALRHIAFCGHPGLDFSDAREEAFRQHPFPERCDTAVFSHRTKRRRRHGIISAEERGAADAVELRAWLQSLPKPVGVIACNDTRGRQILEACAAADLKVPYDVAVIGVDDDDVVCDLAYPPLSSIAPNVETIGFEAATQLEAMMGGQLRPPPVRWIPPIAVEVRTSTDMTALSDPRLVLAVRLIRAELDGGINVKNLLSRVHISRSTFERQFREQLGCTPYEYITRCRIDRVKQLLADTSYPISRVSTMAGFRSVAHMTAVFRTRTGHTPRQFRHLGA